MEDEGLFEEEDEDEAGVLALYVVLLFYFLLVSDEPLGATLRNLWEWIIWDYASSVLRKSWACRV